MAKEYDKTKLEEGILEFPTRLYVFNEKNSTALITLPFGAINKLGIDKDSDLIISLTKK